jgi:hypothetical protein
LTFAEARARREVAALSGAEMQQVIFFTVVCDSGLVIKFALFVETSAKSQ